MTEDPLPNPPSSPKGQVSEGEAGTKALLPHIQLDISVADQLWLDAVPPVKAMLHEVTETVLKCPQSWAHYNDAPATKTGISFCLADDAFVRGLNREFRSHDKVTNVLSFPSGELFVEVLHLGDIAMASGTILKEAAERQKSVLEHTTHLTIHGLLHLLGYTHEKDIEAVEMEALEAGLMKQFGFSDPYIMAEKV